MLEEAAETLQVPVAQLSVHLGVVTDTKDPARKITYGQLTMGKKIERQVTAKPNLKTPDQFRIIGKPLLRKDSREKVTGRAVYAGDVRLPGMLLSLIHIYPVTNKIYVASSSGNYVTVIDGATNATTKVAVRCV